MDEKPISEEERRAESYKNTFGSGDGAVVLEELRATWQNRRLFDSDPLVMAANCALHDAFVVIENRVLQGKGLKEIKRPKVIKEKPDNKYDPNDVIYPEES